MEQYAHLDEEWGLLAGLLPSEWKVLATEKGAIKRARGISDPDVLLRLLLLHASTGLSLKQASARASATGLAEISSVGLHKRLRTSGDWLAAITARMHAGFPERHHQAMSLWSHGRIRAVDATTVEEPGATGTTWRVHYSVRLPDTTCDFFELTDSKGGESYKRLPVEKDDVILGDRGYSHRGGVAYVRRQGGHVVVRLNSGCFPLTRRSGGRFVLLKNLRSLNELRPRQWRVAFEFESTTYNARLCAVRKTREAARIAKEKILKDARKKQKEVRPATLEFAEYVFVLTTLPDGTLTACDVLDLYRVRWQIELVFKRIKSLLGLGHLPKYRDDAARSWIQAKMLTALLIDRLVIEARLFSPWGHQFGTRPKLLA